MRVSIIGTGYVGLVAAAAFADHGNDVVCADADAQKVATLRAGQIPIFEPGLEAVVQRNLDAGRLRFTQNNAEAAAHAEVLFMAVGTPTGDSDGSPDLSALFAAAAEIAPHLPTDAVVVNKSTVPVGTAERVADVIAQHGGAASVVSNPEFLKEGSALSDFMTPDRIIIGTDDARARDVMERLYKPFCRTVDRVLFMATREAELAKYACNAYLATRVSFINDIANLCDAVGADVERVRRAMGSDPRIGPKFLYPGIGYGGSCFPKDTRALLNTARAHGLSMGLVATADQINERQKLVMLGKLRAHLGNAVAGKTVALWGLAFKPNTDDVREAPALAIARGLLNAGAELRLHDPKAAVAFADALGQHPKVSYHPDPYEAAAGADALLLCAEWREYRSPDFSRLMSTMATPALFDGRNQWDRSEVEALGFHYAGIGH